MRISVLCDDRTQIENILPEHGLSLLIETEHHKILFDCGQTDVFRNNARILGCELSDVDTIVLSHGHYDHCNGLVHFLELNSKAKVYVHKKAFGNYFHGDKYIGSSSDLKQHCKRFVLIDKELRLDGELLLLPASKISADHSSSFFRRNEGIDVPDDFEHEIYLLVEEDNRKAMFTGCAHCGVSSIASLAVARGASWLIGGFHLTKDMVEDEIRQIAISLKSLPLQYYSGHCTCDFASDLLKQTIGARYHRFFAGTQFGLGKKADVASLLFRTGYNCSQSVFGAFANELDIPFETAMKLSCSFGGGIGRLREVCGAVSGMLLVCGLKCGYHTPETGTIKAEHYCLVQSLVGQIRSEYGTIYCRDLLGGNANSLPTPTQRSTEFYKTRPCEKVIRYVAELLEKELE